MGGMQDYSVTIKLHCIIDLKGIKENCYEVFKFFIDLDLSTLQIVTTILSGEIK